MSRKYSTEDKEIFHQVFLQYAWMPPAHLAAMMRAMAAVGALDERWSDFHQSTAGTWISEGKWRDEVDSLEQFVDDAQELPDDDEIDDRIMRRNLQILDLLSARIVGEAGDPNHTVRQYIDLQREVRHHVTARRAVPLTPTQVIDLFIQAGYYAAGEAFNEEMAKQFLFAKFTQARQLAPAAG